MKQYVKKCLPAIYDLLRGIKNLWRSYRRFWAFQNRLAEQVFGKVDSIRVLSGPFKGMRYINKPVWGPITPKWLGCYEEELQPVVSGVIQFPYKAIIDIGCAEGYYAVGLAWKKPDCVVRAYDVDLFARKLTKQLAVLNSVGGNLEIKGMFSFPSDGHEIEGPSLVICDIEGAELELFADNAIKSVRQCDVLIEIHNRSDMRREELCCILEKRFESTHRVTPIHGIERDLEKIAGQVAVDINLESLAQAVNEERGELPLWLWLRAGHKH